MPIAAIKCHNLKLVCRRMIQSRPLPKRRCSPVNKERSSGACRINSARYLPVLALRVLLYSRSICCNV
jgi:hypothetical protein